MERLAGLDVDDRAKSQVMRLIRDVGAAHGLTWIERGERVAFARELLRRRVSRATIRDRLIATFDVSRPQAYRIIDNALQLSQKQPKNETPSGFNKHIS